MVMYAGLKLKSQKKTQMTKEQILKETGEEELFCLIDSFLTRWKQTFKDSGQDMIAMMYEFMPTDRETAEIIRKMREN